MPPRPPLGLIPMDVNALNDDNAPFDDDNANLHTPPRPSAPALEMSADNTGALFYDDVDDDRPPPLPHNRQLRSSPEAARRRGLAPLARGDGERTSTTLAHVVAGIAPAPPPPATDRGYLLSSVSRAKGVNTGEFRMAVWSYSPAKKRPQSAAVTTSSYLNKHLTNDLIGIIFEHLPISDLAAASQVCRAWFASADPWAYIEQHGWVPLGPLTRATSAVLRFAPSDHHVAPQLFKCFQHHCRKLVLHLGNGVAAASMALPPYVASSDDTPPLAALSALVLERPSPEDIRMIRERLAPRLPALSSLSIDRISLPIGARDIVVLVRACRSVRELRLSRVSNLTRGSLSELFSAAPMLSQVHLDQCVVALDTQPSTGTHTFFRPTTSNPVMSAVRQGPPPTAAVSSKLKVTATVIPSDNNVCGFEVLLPRQGKQSSKAPHPSAVRGRNEMNASSGATARRGRPPLLTPGQSMRPTDSPRSRSVQPPPTTPASECTACLLQGTSCITHLPPPPLFTTPLTTPPPPFVPLMHHEALFHSQQQQGFHHHPAPPPLHQLHHGAPSSDDAAVPSHPQQRSARAVVGPPLLNRPFVPVHLQHQHHFAPAPQRHGALHGGFYPSLPPLIAVPQGVASSRPLGVAGSLWGLRPAPPSSVAPGR